MSATPLQLDLGPLTPVHHDPTLTIQQRFEQFHEANGWVYDALVKLARDAQARCAALGCALHHAPGRETLLAAARDAVGAATARWLEAPWPADVSHTIADHVAASQQPLCLLDASNAADAGESVLALGLRTVWCLPIPDSTALLYLTADRVEEDDQGLALLAALLAYYQAY